MDAMDILGGLLGGGKKGSGGLGGSVLTDLLGGGRKKRSTPKPTSSGPSRRPVDRDRRAQELEDLLGVAKDRHSGRAGGRSSRPTDSYGSTSRAHDTSSNYPGQRQADPRYADPQRSDAGRTSSGGFSFDARPPVGRREPLDQNEEAIVLIRAMVYAAQSDGRVTQAEQQEIIGRLSNPSSDAINFLRREFERKITARDFAWDVPIGLEHKVYTMSLAAIEVDTRAEANYLKELAHGLRIPPEECNEINLQYGAPKLY